MISDPVPWWLQNVDDDASVHDKLLWAVHMSGFDDLVKFLASAQSEQQWCMHVLEVVSLLFRDQVGTPVCRGRPEAEPHAGVHVHIQGIRQTLLSKATSNKSHLSEER